MAASAGGGRGADYGLALDDQVRQVRSLRAGGEPIADLMRGFGVSRATIYRALQLTEADQLADN